LKRQSIFDSDRRAVYNDLSSFSKELNMSIGFEVSSNKVYRLYSRVW